MCQIPFFCNEFMNTFTYLDMETTTTSKQPAKEIQMLPPSLRKIAAQLEQSRHLKPSEMRRIILEANVQVEDLKPWADFDHPIGDSYGRKLIYKGDNFEIMTMSWRPGDFSTIHDHGHTQWGAVQVFGPAEHATFRVNEGKISTLARWTMKERDAVGVHHTLVHQMGNATHDKFFLSLHVYGEPEDIDNVTGDARVFDLENQTIQRVDGGVFFGLPATQVKRMEEGPQADFPTRLRHMIELIRRLRKMENQKVNNSGKDLSSVVKDFMSAQHLPTLIRDLKANTDEKGHHSHSVFWKILNWELREAARLQNELLHEQKAADHFHQYANLYDEVICKPCMDHFMKNYLDFFIQTKGVDLSDQSVISVGCGTGLVESYMIEELGVPYEQLFGMDLSEAMVAEAQKRIQADVGDVMTLDPSIQLWDIAYSGLNVFQYIDPTKLEEAIQKTANIIKPEGYFIGDFITPDHIRWYPNVIFSADKKTISLRTPELIEEDGIMFQRSEIVNLQVQGEQLRITYAGKHKRYLPPVNRMRAYFEKAFGSQVELYDAISLKAIPEWADSCTSTRYVVIAQKGAQTN